MTSSGTYSFQLANSSIVFEAFDRIGIRATQIDRHHMMSARISINLELLTYSNKGWNFWETTSGTINLAANTAVYALPANLVTMTELYYSAVNAAGSGINADRIMVPITRSEYAQVVNKMQLGLPVQYWFQMLTTPQVTIWQVPAAGGVAPNFVLKWFGLSQIQDANIAGGETPNIHYRATEALIAGLALRLAEKFGPSEPNARAALLKEKKAFFDIAWDDMTRRDQEPGSITFRPNVSVYGRM